MSELSVRQYLHNDGSGLTLGYDKSEADKFIADLDESHKMEVVKLLMEIAGLEEERRWRKVSEELPEDGAEILATDGEGIWLCHKDTISDGSPWFQPDGLPQITGITHWQPLPKTQEGK